MELDTAETCIGRPACSCGEVFDDLLDLTRRELDVRYEPVNRKLISTRAVRGLSRERRDRAGAAVTELNYRRNARSAKAGGQGGQCGQRCVVAEGHSFNVTGG